MASRFLYRGGALDIVAIPSNDSYPVEEGDLVAVVEGKAVPAADMSDVGDAAANRAAFRAAFAGVALQKNGLQYGETSFKLTTDKGYVLVATSGDFEYECGATAWKTGYRVGVYNDGTDNSNQRVVKVDIDAEAIGIAKVPYNALGTEQTRIIVSIRSVLMVQPVNSGA